MSEENKRKLTPFRRKYLSFRVSELRRKVKLQAIEYKGGKCVQCGYDKCPSAMIFHHVDPNEKDYGLSESGISRSFEKSKTELDKCILLCSNCHAELHYEEDQSQRKIKEQEIEAEKRITGENVIKNCLNCSKEIELFFSEIREHNFCSRECKKIYFHNKDWISDFDLLKMSQTMTVKDIALQLNKSIKSVYARLSKIRAK